MAAEGVAVPDQAGDITSTSYTSETFGLKLNGKFNPRVDSFKDLKLRKDDRCSVPSLEGSRGSHQSSLEVPELFQESQYNLLEDGSGSFSSRSLELQSNSLRIQNSSPGMQVISFGIHDSYLDISENSGYMQEACPEMLGGHSRGQEEDTIHGMQDTCQGYSSSDTGLENLNSFAERGTAVSSLEPTVLPQDTVCEQQQPSVSRECTDGLNTYELAGPVSPLGTVSPLDTGRGVRNYSCSQCPGLVFSLLDGPNSIKDHVRTMHQ